MMEVWAKTEAKESENASIERLGWYIAADGSCGFALARVSDPDAAAGQMLEISLALGEFIDLESRVVLDMDSAMGPITDAMAYL